MAFRYILTAAAKVERLEGPASAPEPGEVQIRPRASSLNYHDLVVFLGLQPVEYPRVPLSDGCGEITAVGEEVDGYAIGDRVLPMFFPLWRRGRPTPANKRLVPGDTIDGCLQEFLNIDARSVVPAPATLNDAQAATLNCAAHTAWYALMEEGKLQAGQTVLVQGSGGVSLFALQFAKALGAKVIATSSSDEKLSKLEELGADHLVNYREHSDWEQQVMRLTGAVDVVVDVGGPATLGRSVSCTRNDGFIAVIGILSGFDASPVPVVELMQKNLTVKGITVGCGESLQRMGRFIDEHQIEPCISHRIAAADLAQGFELMQAGRHFGKISVDIE